MSSMEYDQFKSRLSKYQKQYDPDLCTLQRESFAIDLRKSKRQLKHQKFRINQVIPKCGNIPEELLKKFQIFCPQNLSESIGTFRGLLNSGNNLLETLKCLNYFLERLSECGECEVLIRDLIELLGQNPQSNGACYDCILQCSYLVEVFGLAEKDIKALFGDNEGVTIRVRMFLAYNLLVDEKLENSEIELMIHYLFEYAIEENDGPIVLEILKRVLKNKAVDLLPGLNWLSANGLKSISTRATSLKFIFLILKNSKQKTYISNLLENQVDKVLFNMILNNECDIVIGLKILNKIFAKSHKNFNQFKSDHVKALLTLTNHPDFQIKRLTIILLKKHLDKVTLNQTITPRLVKELIPNLIHPNPEIQVKALKFANYILFDFTFSLKYFIDSSVFSTLSKFISPSLKSQKLFYILCTSLVDYNPEYVTELEQNSLFEVFETFDSWLDEDSKTIYDNLVALRPTDKYFEAGPVTTFIFS